MINRRREKIASLLYSLLACTLTMSICALTRILMGDVSFRGQA
jgi:hypothetical protein